MAGLGAAINTGNVGRGDSVAVIGCGGVGAAAVVGARLAGAANDHRHRHRRRASSSGARSSAPPTRSTPRIGPTSSSAIQELTGGFGADVVIDAVGRPETWKQAFYARDLAGTVVLVGVPTPDMKLPEMPLIDVFGRGGALKSSWYGDCLPTRDFPMLIDLHLQGRLDLDALRLRDDRARRRGGRVRQDAPRRRAALGRGPLMAARIDQGVLGHLHPRRRDLRRRQQRLGGRRRHRVRRDRRPARRRRDPGGRRRPHGQGDPLHARPRRPRRASRRRCASG